MLQEDRTDIFRTASAVSLRHVTKEFLQWQRDNTGKGMIRNLWKPEKKTITALGDVSFGIEKGEFIAYAGPNGAGKSTTMKLLSGMLLPTAGDISVLGMSPKKERRALMHRLGVLFGSRTELWWDHPVIRSYEWKKVVWNIPEEEYRRNLETVTELLDLKDLLKTFTRELSLGQRMRADLAMLLLHSPELILLDEPTLGLDVVAKRRMIDFLKRINRENGVTVVVTSHDMDDLEEMARRILMISGGKIAYDGDFDGLRKITGNLTRVVITMSDDTVPDLRNSRLLSSQNGVHDFETDLRGSSVKKLMKYLSEVDGIADVEIKRAPIEHVIARLYDEWR